MSSVHDGKEREEERERKQAFSLGYTDKTQNSPRHTYKPDRKCEFLSLSGHKRQRGKLLLNADTVPLLCSPLYLFVSVYKDRKRDCR